MGTGRDLRRRDSRPVSLSCFSCAPGSRRGSPIGSHFAFPAPPQTRPHGRIQRHHPEPYGEDGLVTLFNRDFSADKPCMPAERVLIVDDNPMNLKLARILLTGDGFEVRTAADAEEAEFI